MSDLLTTVFRRLAYGVLALALLLTGVFFLSRYVGDPVARLAGSDPTPDQIRAIRASLGLDQPVIVQYGHYVQQVFTGDMGISYRLNRPALQLVLERLPATLELTALAMVMATLIAVPIGVLTALRPNGRLDAVSRLFAVVGQSVPTFWLAILLIIVFSVHLHVLPATGVGTWQHLVLPAVTLSAYSVPITMRLTRSAMLEVLHQDYIRTAIAKGLQPRQVIIRHALRNALIPIITIVALRLGSVITGAIVLEQVFAYPGLGRIAVQSMLQSDFPVIQAFILVVAVLVMAVNLFADLLYAVVDPRVRVH